MSLLTAVDLLGVLSFALSGCLLASSKRFDILGSLLLGGLVGLGGARNGGGQVARPHWRGAVARNVRRAADMSGGGGEV